MITNKKNNNKKTENIFFIFILTFIYFISIIFSVTGSDEDHEDTYKNANFFYVINTHIIFFYFVD